MSISLSSLCFNSIEIIRTTGDFIRREVGKVAPGAVEEKDLNSLVSYVDKTAERQLTEALGKILPQSVFLTEEDTIENQEGEWQWIIDPLDGTTNFLHQLPCFSVSVALRHKAETVMGVVYEINQDECFYAWKEGGAFLDRRPIRVSNRPGLPDSLLATGFPYYNYTRIRPYLTALEHFMQHTRGIRRLGSAAVDLAYVACGRFDAFFEYGLQPWDVAAGAFIIRQAGGTVTDFRGGDSYLFGGDLIAGNPMVAEEVLSVIKEAFGDDGMAV